MKSVFLSIALALIAVNAVAASPSPCAAPANLADGWMVQQDAQSGGFDAGRLCEVLNNFAGSDINFHSLIVERHGKLVAEVYRRGKDESIYSLFASTTDFDVTTLHDTRSISKSVVSLLWGIAQSQAKTPPLSTPVLDLLPDLHQFKSDGREKITLAHLLTMSSGLDWNEPNAYNKANDELGLYWRSSQARYLFNRPMAAPAGTRYNYNGGGTAVLAQILVERTGMSLPDYARKVLFEPLGITEWEWKNDLRGRPLAFAGLRMRSRDLARIGRMVLANGQWQGKQIVPADWIRESIRAHIDMGNEPGWQYGYQWWIGKTEALGASHLWSAGFGNGGQRLFLIPSLDMAVVITAGDYNKSEIGRETYRVFKAIAAAVRE